MKKHPTTQQPVQSVPDGKRTLYYQPLPRPRADSVSAVLVGYRKENKDRWY